jgi:hypothetical protein
VDKTNKVYVGAISLGSGSDGERKRRKGLTVVGGSAAPGAPVLT